MPEDLPPIGANHKRPLSIIRAVLALAVGTVIGAVALELSMMLGELDYTVPSPKASFSDFVSIFIYGSVLWGIGLFVIAPLPWALLHHLGWRSLSSAVGLGATLAALTTFAIMNDWMPVGGSDPSERTLPAAIIFAGIMAVQGALVATAVWWIAYRWPEWRAQCERCTPTR